MSKGDPKPLMTCRTCGGRWPCPGYGEYGVHFSTAQEAVDASRHTPDDKGDPYVYQHPSGLYFTCHVPFYPGDGGVPSQWAGSVGLRVGDLDLLGVVGAVPVG